MMTAKDQLETIAGTLERLLSLAERLVVPPLTPGAGACVRQQPPGSDHLLELALITAAIDATRPLILEGGNPIGPETALLAESLAHLEKARQLHDSRRVEAFAAIAHALRGLVQEAALLVLERRARRPATTEVGRFG